MAYRSSISHENLNKALFFGVGKYGIPELKPEEYHGCEWIGFNYAKSCRDRENKGVHFFLDDYQFVRLWTHVNQYIGMLSEFDYVMSPDFSTYTDYPVAMQIYNHYRKHWVGAYLQSCGIKVIPTISWSNEESFEWCFSGEPTHAVVAVSSVGTQRGKKEKESFLSGYHEMVRRLEPDTIIFYGKVPEECKGNIVRVKAFQEKFKEALCNGW